MRPACSPSSAAPWRPGNPPRTSLSRRRAARSSRRRLEGDLRYVESTFFTTDDDGTGVVNVVLLGDIGDQTPVNAAPDEVGQVVWRTLDEVAADDACPQWTLQSLRRAAALVTDG